MEISEKEFVGFATVESAVFDTLEVQFIYVGYTDDDDCLTTGRVVIGGDEQEMLKNPAFARFDAHTVVYYVQDLAELYSMFLVPNAFADATLVWVDGVNTLPDDVDERGRDRGEGEVMYTVDFLTRVYVYATSYDEANERSIEVLRETECRQCSKQLEHLDTYITR